MLECNSSAWDNIFTLIKGGKDFMADTKKKADPHTKTQNEIWADASRNYNAKMTSLKIRFPAARTKPKEKDATPEPTGFPDYSAIIQAEAAKHGESVNNYILDLIEADIRTNTDPDFRFIRGLRKKQENEK